MGPPGRRYRRRVHALLRGPGRQEEVRPATEDRTEGRVGSDSGDRPRSRRRIDQLAPEAGAQAQSARAANRVPRDYRGGDQRGAARGARRRRREPRPGPGEPADSRSPLRLYLVARALEEGADRPERWPGPERRGPPDRRARRRADGVPDRQLLGSRSEDSRRRSRVHRDARPRRRRIASRRARTSTPRVS